jgi:hypothetical protein
MMANAALAPSSSPALSQALVVLSKSSEEITDTTMPDEPEW